MTDLTELAEHPRDEVILGHAITAAHRAFLLSLPPDGAWKATRDAIRAVELEYGSNSLRGFGQSGLIEGYYREEVRHKLTKEGVKVAQALRARSQ
jgi:hypothetical protein